MLAHRGPSGTGAGGSKHWVFAHSRLAVLDPKSRSDQPFFAPDGSHALLFNGEIFNHADLRASLGERWSFTTTGDTEVLLAGLLLQGSVFLSSVQGMYAFVLVDSVSGELLIGRDPLGIKPLFARVAGGRVQAAASTQRVLTAGSTADFDADNLRQTLLFGTGLDGSGAVGEVRSLPPGAVWKIQSSGRHEEERRFSPLKAGSSHPFAEAFQDTVRRHLVSDIPVGVALSGGLDSSAIAAAAVGLGAHPHCFTVHFPNDAASDTELAAARAVTAHLGLRHTIVDVGADQALEALRRPGLWDEPFAEGALIPLNRLAAAAGDLGVRVLLTGEGSDEFFGGYRRFAAFHRMARLPRTSLPTRLPLDRLGRHLGPRAERVADALAARPLSPARYLWMISNLRPDAAAALFHLDRPALEGRFAAWVGSNNERPFGLDEASEFERHSWLPSVYLRKLDLATMAEGVEGRVPFVDTTFLGHASRTVGKGELREAMRGRLPDEILARPKQGFGTPMSTWLREALADDIKSVLRDSRLAIWDVADRSVAQRLWEQPGAWLGGHGGFFFALYRWSRWLGHAAAP